MTKKTIEHYIVRLQDRKMFLESDQLGDDKCDQTMVAKEIYVLESVIKDLQEMSPVEHYRCFSYWTC